MGGKERFTTLRTYLDGEGVANFSATSAELDDVGLLVLQLGQEQGFEFDEKQRGKNAMTLSIADASSAASYSIVVSELTLERIFLVDCCVASFAVIEVSYSREKQRSVINCASCKALHVHVQSIRYLNIIGVGYAKYISYTNDVDVTPT